MHNSVRQGCCLVALSKSFSLSLTSCCGLFYGRVVVDGIRPRYLRTRRSGSSLTTDASQPVIDYDHASVATYVEAEEMVAMDFFELVERWLAANHPNLIP